MADENTTYNYADLNELRAAWVNGEFDYPERMTVNGILYKFRSSSVYKFIEIVKGDSEGIIVYNTTPSNRKSAQEVDLDTWIVFGWASNGLTLFPREVRTTPPHRDVNIMEDVERIGDVAILKIQFPSGVAALKAKVDTGADICSLHADEIEIVGDVVKFTNSQISNNVITVPLADKQAVKSADGGVTYRPVIELDVELNGKPVKKVLFNLNDRSDMEHQCLVGQNLLEKTKFLVDPRQDGVAESDEDDSVDFKALQELLSECTPISEAPAAFMSKEKEVQWIMEYLSQSNITFKDLASYVKKNVLL